MARAMGTNASARSPFGAKEPFRGDPSAGAKAFLRPSRAGVFPARFHRADALGYYLTPLTGLSAVPGQEDLYPQSSSARRVSSIRP
jgi:hypothetical protein